MINEFNEYVEEITNNLIKDKYGIDENATNTIIKFKEWLKTKESLKTGYFDKRTILDCFLIQNKINTQDTDHIEVVTGKEGLGKSTLILQKCCYIDPTFCLDRIFYRIEDLFLWFQKNRKDTKGKAILLDEGNLFLFNREGQGKTSKSIIKLFSLVRQCNLYLGICIPDYRTLDKQIRRHRMASLTNIDSRGKTRVFDNPYSINNLNFKNEKGIPINKISDSKVWFGSFHKKIPTINDITEESYRAIKKDEFYTFIDESVEKLKDKKTDFGLVNVKEASVITGLEVHNIRKKANSGELESLKIGKKIFVKLPKLNNIDNKTIYHNKLTFNTDLYNEYTQRRSDLE